MVTIVIELENFSRMWVSLALQRLTVTDHSARKSRNDLDTSSAPTITEVPIQFRSTHLVPPAAHCRTEDFVPGNWRRPQPPAGTAT
jgi:hypothetical protein